MNPTIFSACILKLHEEFSKDNFALLNGDFVDGPKSLLKLLEYATMIESEDALDLPGVVIRGFKNLPKKTAQWIVSIRNSKLFSSLSLQEERFVYKTLRAIYAVGIPPFLDYESFHNSSKQDS